MVETRPYNPEKFTVMSEAEIRQFARTENVELTEAEATEVLDHWTNYLNGETLNKSELRQLINTFKGTSPVDTVELEEAAS